MRGRGLYVAAIPLAIAGVVMLGAGLYWSNRDPIGPPETLTVTATEDVVLPEDSTAAAVDPGYVDVPVPVADVAAPAAGTPLPAVELVPTRVRIPTELTRLARVFQVGPSVVVGHVDSAVAGRGVVFDLRKLVKGDAIEIERSDGTIAAFRVTDVATVSKDEFPTELVYGSTAMPPLRLITCGGSFDRSVRSYEHNVIVFAEFLGNRETPVARS